MQLRAGTFLRNCSITSSAKQFSEMMKNKIKIVAIVGMVALVALTFFESRQMAQTQVKTAGQKFKNIKVLNDMTADQMGQVMNMMSASLGFNCAGCHAARHGWF